MKKIVFFFFLAFLLAACSYTPSRRIVFPAEYTTGWQEIYGHCYDSVPYAVVALDLYSDGLELDKDHRMQGTGHNLYLSDIFVPDSLLTPGTYTSLAVHDGVVDAPRAFTFLPGRDWEGTPSGMYLLYVEEGKLQSIQLLDSGRMVVRDTLNDLTDIRLTLYYKNAYGYKATYESHFQGSLSPWQKQ